MIRTLILTECVKTKTHLPKKLVNGFLVQPNDFGLIFAEWYSLLAGANTSTKRFMHLVNV